MLNNPDIVDEALPDFVLEKVQMHRLEGEWKGDPSLPRFQHDHLQPDYDNPYFLGWFEEMQQMLAEKYNGSDLIEYMDTTMYGFWGEGHTWPYEGNLFRSYDVAEKTLLKMYGIQNRCWSKVPLLTNTQPDFSRVGNSEVIDRSVRDNNWLRTDTIFIENEQIEALSNRPAWCAAAVECGLSDGHEETMRFDNAGIPLNEAIISHVKDVGANYFSLWNWHNINVDNLYRYYEKHPEGLDDLVSCIGFRVRPSWIWHSESRDGNDILIFGMVNDGIACLPGEEQKLSHLSGLPWCRYHNEYFFVEPTDKAVGIRRVMDHFGADYSDAVVFGDALNDLSMFIDGWTKVAMGNAVDAIKERADYITTDVEEDGIYNACEALGLFE